MTERLYYTDPRKREFDAIVSDLELDGAAGRGRLRLDRTCFYPTSGGQPHDTGTLDGLQVVDVVDEEDGGIVHVVELPGTARLEPEAGAVVDRDETVSGLKRGSRVRGSIDWARRFDHMQQHSGQHVLSASFARLFGVRTESFHLGAEASTIDLAREMTMTELAAAEEESNRIVWDDRPVAIRFASAKEAAALPLRKESVRSGPLRLIEIEDFDLSACGGTHVARTGQIGLIAIAAWERFKGGQRIGFCCGRRALALMRSLRDTTLAGARLLSVPGVDIPDAIARLQAEARESRRSQTALQLELARHQADALAASAETTSRGRFVLTALDGNANALKALATAIVARGALGAVLVSPARPALTVVACAPDVAVSSAGLLGRLTSKFGGRGGGKPDLAQGGGLDAPAEAILSEARAFLNEAP